MRALIVAVGTRGDVQPALALGHERRRREHDVRLCTSPNFVEWAERLGLEAVPMGVDERMVTDPAIRERARHEITALRNRSPEILAGLTMPVLYLEGEEDLVFPPLAGPALAKATPDGSCRSVPAAGHSAYFERAAEFNAIVDEFVAKRVFSDRTQRT